MEACALIIPRPMQLEPLPGQFVLTPEVRIGIPPGADEDVRFAGRVLREAVLSATGLELALLEETADANGGASSAPAGGILLTTSDAPAGLGNEGYELTVAPGGVLLRAASGRGLFYGVQTLRQLLSPPPAAPALPALRVTDRPRYAWRGFMLDCSRHFMDKAFVRRVLDLMAFHKLNVFHWHLIDNNGWRMEVASYPKLIETGAWRGPVGDRYGGYYTKDDIREIVACAAERHITVVPEFEMPGHSDAALACYPELTCSGEPWRFPEGPLPDDHLQWFARSGRRPFCAGRDEVFAFHEAVFDEALELFPSPVWHVGGDERPQGVWETCPRCQARMKAEGLRDEHDLQNWFMRRIAEILARKGKRVISWAVTRTDPYNPSDMDDLGHGAMVQNWHDGAAFAARQGWDTVNSNNLFVYFDYPELPEQRDEKPDWMPMLGLETVYAFNPTPEGLSPEEARHIVGTEACLWTEQVPQEEVDIHIFPRLLAVAETAWTPQEKRDYADFLRRLAPHQARLEAMGVRFRKPKRAGA